MFMVYTLIVFSLFLFFLFTLDEFQRFLLPINTSIVSKNVFKRFRFPDCLPVEG